MNELGRWITNGTDTPFYLRRTFDLKKEPVSVHASVCGLGQCVFYANDRKISDHEMDPGWTDYRKYAEYAEYDLTGLLHEGKNVVGAEVANGWFIMDHTGYSFHFPDFMPENPNPYHPFGKFLVFCMKLIVQYEDGSEETITADENFRTMKHPVLHSNVYGSEVYDASLVQKDWLKPDFDDSSWKKAVIVNETDEPHCKLVKQIQPPVKVIHTYEGKYLHKVNGRTIYDFSQNMACLLEFDIQGKPGDVVKLYPAEKLKEDGNVDQMAKGWVPIDTVITYVIGSEKTEHYRERFAYIGCRYVGIEALDDVKITHLKAHAITSAWKKSGSFTCDDVRYNQIYDLVEKAVEANMQSVHTDCPTIERFAWEEENHLMMPSILFMKDGRKLWEKFLLDMRTGQHIASDYFLDLNGNKILTGDGLIPSQCPCYIPNFIPVPGMGSFYDTIAWGSSIILCPWYHYQFYGDQEIMDENFEAGFRYLKYLKTKLTPEGFISHGLGDWGNPDEEYARENVETAFLYADAMTLVKTASVIGRPEETELKQFADEILKNYNEKLLQKDAEGHYAYRCYDQKDAFVMSQACEAMPLYWHMVPAYVEKDIISAFAKTLKEKNCLACGEISLPYVIATAKQYGMNDLIAEFITREEHPSYYAFVKEGETTLGEYWESNPRSHCHDMMGSIIEWYYTGIAGIQIRKPGFQEISIHPWMPESMNSFDCTYETKYGKIEVHGRRKEGKPVFTWSVPSKIKVIE